MKRWLLSVTVFFAFTGVSVADERPLALQAPPPRFSMARMADDGTVEFVDITYHTEDRMIQRTIIDPDGTTRKVLQAVRTPITRPIVTRVKPEDVKAFDVAGREIPTKDLPLKLKAQKPVLVSADGHAVDPSYLRLAKDDTLVFVSANLLLPDPSQLPDAKRKNPIPVPVLQP